MTAPIRQGYGYDSFNRLQSFTEGLQGSAATLSETYCFDEHGNRAVMTGMLRR